VNALSSAPHHTRNGRFVDRIVAAALAQLVEHVDQQRTVGVGEVR
jgi:hypothetical protein